MRTFLDSSIHITKLGLKWFAFLHVPDAGWEVLGISEWLGDLCSDCMLNSTFDRKFWFLKDHGCEVVKMLNE